MKKRFLFLFISFFFGIQLSMSQLVYNNQGESRKGSVYESRCLSYLREKYSMFEDVEILTISDVKLSNGNTFVFTKIKLSYSVLEDGYIPNNVFGIASSGVSRATVRVGDSMTEFHMIVVNADGEPIKDGKFSENFEIWKLMDGYYCFALEKSSQKLNGNPYTFYNYLICYDCDGNQRWSFTKDVMAFSMLKTDNNFYLAGEKVGDTPRSMVRGIDIRTGKVVSEKIGDAGNICIGISFGSEGLDVTEFVRSTNTNRFFSFPVEANDKDFFFRKVMSVYDKNNATDQVAIGERYLKGKGFDKDEKKAFEWFQKAANQNNSEGLFQLAKCYQKGIGVNQDKAKAVTYYEKSVSLNNTNAILALSDMYANGDGVEKNMSKALSLKEKLAFDGNVDAQRFVLSNQSIEYTKVNIPADKLLSHARESYKNRNYEWAKLCYERAINLGNNDAMYDYGLWLYEGIGITKDCYKAIDYLSKLGEGNNLDAQKLLINIYKDNKGIVPDAKQEMYWRMKAADNGDIESQLKLATAYRNGIGVKKNKKLAFEMLSRAAYNGNEDAIYQVVICYATGYGVKKDLDYSVIWAKKLSQKKMFEVAHAFENGIGLKANSSVAMMLYEFLASQNHFNATVSLSRLYISLGYYKDAEKTIGSIDRITNISYSTRESETYYLMGLLRESERRFQDALSCYKNSSKPEAKQCYDRLYSWWKRNNFPSR